MELLTVSFSQKCKQAIMERFLYHFPLHELILLYSFSVSLAMPATNISTDQSALLALKAHISSDPLQILAKNWSLQSSACEWIGVTCGSRHRRVIALNIPNMALVGTIPPEMGNLSFLRSFNLSINGFHGEIPPELARLRRLRVLDLCVNDLSGDLPRWFGNSFPELQTLSLRNNSFTGFIPPSISNISKLEILFLGYNSLVGNIPGEIFNVSSLERVSLVGNRLSGSIPDDMCENLPRLVFLSLSLNGFSGEIPSSLGQCSELVAMSLSFNNFIGSIPKGIGNLKKLEVIYLCWNNLTGEIPKEIANLTNLMYIDLNTNHLTGEIPSEMSDLNNLQTLNLGFNNFSGSVPMGIFNLSMATIMSFGGNSLSGKLPSTFGSGLPNLERLYLNTNNFDGAIPESISNSSKLQIVELSQNHFTGVIPNSLGNLRFLEALDLADNNLVNDPSSRGLSLINVLVNSRNLAKISIANNQINANLPDSIGNLSKTLEYIIAYNCELSGSIPDGIGNLTNLIVFSLYRNQLTGSFPSTVKNLLNLQAIVFGINKLSKMPLDYFCGLKKLGHIDFGQNQLSGTIPKCLGNVTTIRELYLGSNKLNSTIPNDLWKLIDLLELNLSSNSLTGSLPLQVSKLRMATKIDLSKNRLSGGIPINIGDMQNIIYLSLAHNRLRGSIPESVGNMLSLQTLDLSLNFLSGSIPMSMETLQYLRNFNVSFNNLSGEIPPGGPFQNFSSESFTSNHALCGSDRFHVPPCPRNSTRGLRPKMTNVIKFVLIGVTIVVAVLGIISLIFMYLRYRKKHRKGPDKGGLSLKVGPERISYYTLLQATDGYNESNLLGSGSFGSVYKGTLDDGRVVAIKVLNLHLEGAFKSFDSECEALCNLRHRNIVKVISCCSNPEFKALVLEFMPNGSVDRWLYSNNHCLDIMQRLDVLIDVAIALEYLHCDCYSSPVVHCDLKPSNILLDENMVAHVSDFGMVKLLGEGQDSFAHTTNLATLGYLAPEYGMDGLVSTRCDVYSYGIMMMEVFTRTNPNNEMFAGDLSIRSWVNDHMPNAFAHIIDANMLSASDEYYMEKMDCIISVMKVALNCTRESPRERDNIQDVLLALKKIKGRLQPYHRQN